MKKQERQKQSKLMVDWMHIKGSILYGYFGCDMVDEKTISKVSIHMICIKTYIFGHKITKIFPQNYVSLHFCELIANIN